MEPRILATHAAATFVMVGIIWFVQIVHYPLFARVGADVFPAYQAANTRWTTWVVLLPMTIELVTGALLAARPGDAVAATLTRLGLALIVLVWASTVLVQSPAHGRLAQAFDGTVHAWLVGSNWLRTAAWSVRAALVAVLLVRELA